MGSWRSSRRRQRTGSSSSRSRTRREPRRALSSSSSWPSSHPALNRLPPQSARGRRFSASSASTRSSLAQVLADLEQPLATLLVCGGSRIDRPRGTEYSRIQGRADVGRRNRSRKGRMPSPAAAYDAPRIGGRSPPPVAGGARSVDPRMRGHPRRLSVRGNLRGGRAPDRCGFRVLCAARCDGRRPDCSRLARVHPRRRRPRRRGPGRGPHRSRSDAGCPADGDGRARRPSVERSAREAPRRRQRRFQLTASRDYPFRFDGSTRTRRGAAREAHRAPDAGRE